MSRSVAIILLVTLISVCQAAYREFIPGNLRTTGTYTLQTCDKNITACQSCISVQICLAGQLDNTNLVINCPSSTPFCNKNGSPTGGTCGVRPDDECKEAFICPGVGYFPNPEACDNFYYCEENGKTGENYVCPTGYQYSTAKQECQRAVTACPKVACDPQKIFVPYPQSNSFYVFCQYDKTSATLKIQKMYILACGAGLTFNVQTQTCEFRCTREGFFASPGNPKQYIQCYLDGITWKSLVQTCKDGYIFDATVSRCTKDPSADQQNIAVEAQNDNEVDMNTSVVPIAPVAPSNTGCIDFIANLLQNSRSGL